MKHMASEALGSIFDPSLPSLLKLIFLPGRLHYITRWHSTNQDIRPFGIHFDECATEGVRRSVLTVDTVEPHRLIIHVLLGIRKVNIRTIRAIRRPERGVENWPTSAGTLHTRLIHRHHSAALLSMFERFVPRPRLCFVLTLRYSLMRGEHDIG